MKCYIIKESDINNLLLLIDRDPKHGLDGGSCNDGVRDVKANAAYDDAHRFYNYQIRKWLDTIRSEL